MKKFQIIITLFTIIFVQSFFISSSVFAESVHVSTDKLMYLDGESITIQGTISKYNTYPVSIEIVDPVGKSIDTIPLIPNYNGEYFLLVKTGSRIWQHDGVYRVIVTHASIPNSEKITFEYFHSEPKPKPLGAGALGEEHAQAKLVTTVYGYNFDFSLPKFQMQSPWIRFEDSETIHRYSTGVPLGFLFDTLGLSGKNDECYRFQGDKVYCTNAYFTYKFIINGKHVSEKTLREYVIQNGDDIQIIYNDQFVKETLEIKIPDWIRDVAGFWCNDEIDDAAFIGAIQFLMENKIIVVPVSDSGEASSGEVPSWIKTNACWWSGKQISDDEFAKGLEYLIKVGVIVV
jgi:hypothetical protein